ncbi:hypothetical protein D021_4568B, partial [Vibrio parahaemolyticus 10296]
FL